MESSNISIYMYSNIMHATRPTMLVVGEVYNSTAECNYKPGHML